MAKFHSDTQQLVLQDGDAASPWAEFVDHVFRTDDTQVVDRLRALDPEHGITEVPDEQPSTEAPAAVEPAAVVEPTAAPVPVDAPVVEPAPADPTPVDPSVPDVAPADPIA